MSHDLYFGVRPSDTPPPSEAIAGHFAARDHYTIQGAEAEYENEDTGVYFRFDWSVHEPDSDEEGDSSYVAYFNVNYNRPSFFGHEAFIELKAFVDKFSLTVDGMEFTDSHPDTGFSEARFLSGWNAGNQFGIKVRVTEGASGEGDTMPRDLLHRCWRWNYQRSRLQAHVGQDLFVPKISAIELDGRLMTMAVWGDLIPSVLPRVDVLLVPLDRHKGLFGRRDVIRVVSMASIEPLLGGYSGGSDPLQHWRAEYRTPPKALVRVARNSPKAGKLSIVSWDVIADSELVELARGK